MMLGRLLFSSLGDSSTRNTWLQEAGLLEQRPHDGSEQSCPVPQGDSPWTLVLASVQCTRGLSDGAELHQPWRRAQLSLHLEQLLPKKPLGPMSTLQFTDPPGRESPISPRSVYGGAAGSCEVTR